MGNISTSKEIAIAAKHFLKEKEYWLNKLSGELSRTYFPYDYNKDENQERKTGTVTIPFPGKLSAKIMAAVGGSDIKLFMILAAGLFHLLNKYTHSSDIIIGIPIEKQDMEGQFINTALALRSKLDEQMTFKEVLMRVRQDIVEATKNQNYPIETIPLDLNMTIPASGDFPLFDVALLLENIHEREYIQYLNCNILFSFLREDEHLQGAVEYNPQVYARETIELIGKYYIYLLQESLFNADAAIGTMDLLPGKEKEEVVYGFNHTAADYPGNQTIQELFHRQAGVTPQQTAVLEGNRQITYQALDREAESLSLLFREKGVKPGTIVAIMGHRSIEMIIIILGILKARGAYLPINAQDPADRIEYILKDSKAHLLITPKPVIEKHSHLLQSIPGKQVLAIEDLEADIMGGASPGARTGPTLTSTADPTDTAYIIYTSGTTGRPKGVIIQQRALVNYIWWAASTYVKNEKIDFPFYTSFSYDMSITSIFTPLVTGNAIVIYGGDEKEFILEKVIQDNRVEIVKATPSHLKLLRDREIKNSKIKRLIVGGEELETQLAKEITGVFPGDIEIYNEYGPTEATVGCMIYKYNPARDIGKTVPIGVPIHNTQIYILDTRLKPVPAGVSAELYISGDGLAQGYLFKPGLTGERFITNPFIPGKIMYKTGDLARRLPDGNIEFLGRKDHQVKIRGYRIELGEIEYQLQQLVEIKEAIVVTKKNEQGDPLLCAYYVPHQEISLNLLKEHLSEKLPDYMFPQFFVKIDQIPVAQNGKLDTKALPEPTAGSEQEYVPPGTDLELRLVQIWSEVLGIENRLVGIKSNFFELGGHSLSATTLLMKIEKEFNVKLSLREIFKFPTVSGISGIIESTEWVNADSPGVEIDQEREELVI